MAAVLRMVRENLRATGLPVPMPRGAVEEWASGLGLPGRSSLVLYTGALYQMAPYINGFVAGLEAIGRAGPMGDAVLRAAAALSRFGATGLARLLFRPSRGDLLYARSVLRAAARLLSAAGVEYAYPRGVDGYSGVLLHDLGLEEEFARHAQLVYRRLSQAGARGVITLDPHTTYALKVLYPRFVDGYDLEVHSYLELLADALERGRLRFPQAERGTIVLHDPCYYARFLGIVEEPRRLLRAAGYTVAEPRRSGKLTHCCGGPVESVAPHLARSVARRRIDELAALSSRVVVMCPMCWANLARVAPPGVEVRDVALYLWDALSK